MGWINQWDPEERYRNVHRELVWVSRRVQTGLARALTFSSRQAMSSTKAWQRHGCYHLGAEALYELPLTKATLGCKGDWNLLDHFDPTADL